MDLSAEKIRKIYTSGRATRYDMALPHSFSKWKKKAFDESSLKTGDHVIVFCCGTGLDFPYIIEKIGHRGKITGIDFSSEMLEKAKDRIKRNHWQNVELLQADVTDFKNKLKMKADAGVCTLGLSIIPDYKLAYYNLLSNVKTRGDIIIGDMQLASGWLSRLNPITVFLSKGFGGTFEGHQNSLELFELMKKELDDLRKREFFFNSYYYCIGKKRQSG